MNGGNLIDSWLWAAKPVKARRILNQYLTGKISFPEFKIKLYYLKREAEKINQLQMEL